MKITGHTCEKDDGFSDTVDWQVLPCLLLILFLDVLDQLFPFVAAVQIVVGFVELLLEVQVRVVISICL